METRKVQLAGGSTYTVSLPKRWAAEHDIEAGRRLCLYPNDDGSLVVQARPEASGEGTMAHVNVDSLSEEDLRRTVHALYAVGLDEFTLSVSHPFEPDRRRAITTATENLIGLEVTTETDQRVEFQCLLNPTDVSVRQSVLQLQFVALSMCDNAVDALTTGDTDLAGHVRERDDEADRLFALVNRHFQRTLSSMQEVERLGIDRRTAFAYYTTARQLERVADHAERIAETAIRFETHPPTDPLEEIAALARRSNAVVEDAASVLLGGGDTTDAYRALEARDRLVGEVETLDRTLYEERVRDAYLLALVLDSVERIAEYGGNVAETAVQTSLYEQ